MKTGRSSPNSLRSSERTRIAGRGEGSRKLNPRPVSLQTVHTGCLGFRKGEANSEYRIGE